jgi:hypothetical protein
MGAKLETCAGCARHVRIDEERCPFCERPRVAKKARAVAALAASVAFGMTLAACYGRPPPPGGWGPPTTPPVPSSSGSIDETPSAFGPPAPTEIGPPAPPSKKAKGR